MRKLKFITGEYYHIFNRGVDKRIVFQDKKDLERFLKSMEEFNTINPIGSIYEHSRLKNKFGNLVSKKTKLVNFICYCLNPNHYHFILEQLVDGGIEKFMHRLGVGYTNYFNKRYNRSGALFQGTFKAIHISSNEYLLHLSAYVNLNDKVHNFGNLVSKKSSWEEYVGNKDGFCKKDIILNQFNSISEYRNFSKVSLEIIKERKEMEKLLLE